MDLENSVLSEGRPMQKAISCRIPFIETSRAVKSIQTESGPRVRGEGFMTIGFLWGVGGIFWNLIVAMTI